MRILVTGISGFVGSHLAEALFARDPAQVWGVSRHPRMPDGFAARQVDWKSCDLADRHSLIDLVRQVQPSQVYHLAGYASSGRSYREPDAAWESNLTATRNLYEAIIAWGGRPRILHISSGLVYGAPTTDEGLVNEEAPLRPVSPYAASKAAADLAAYQFSRAPGLEIVRVRPFNHIGPRQSADFAAAGFARQIAAIEAGRQPPVLETEDLRPHRDLTDVRDVVRAYTLLMEKGAASEVYNVGSGVTHTMQEVLDRLLALSRMRPELRQKARPERAAEAMALRADCRKLRGITGWEPQFSLDRTLADTLDYWRSALRGP